MTTAEEILRIENPAHLPDAQEIKEIKEPYIKAVIRALPNADPSLVCVKNGGGFKLTLVMRAQNE